LLKTIDQSYKTEIVDKNNPVHDTLLTWHIDFYHKLNDEVAKTENRKIL